MDIYKEKITMKTFRLHTIIVKCAETLNRLSGKGELRKERNSGFLSSLLSLLSPPPPPNALSLFPLRLFVIIIIVNLYLYTKSCHFTWSS